MLKIRFEDNTQNVKKATEKKRAKALTNAAIYLERQIVLKTPVDTGHLRASISFISELASSQSKVIEDETLLGTATVGVAYVGTNCTYATHVEFGTKYQKAQSYMRTGHDQAKPVIDKILEREMSV